MVEHDSCPATLLPTLRSRSNQHLGINACIFYFHGLLHTSISFSNKKQILRRFSDVLSDTTILDDGKLDFNLGSAMTRREVFRTTQQDIYLIDWGSFYQQNETHLASVLFAAGRLLIHRDLVGRQPYL